MVATTSATTRHKWTGVAVFTLLVAALSLVSGLQFAHGSHNTNWLAAGLPLGCTGGLLVGAAVFVASFVGAPKMPFGNQVRTAWSDVRRAVLLVGLPCEAFPLIMAQGHAPSPLAAPVAVVIGVGIVSIVVGGFLANIAVANPPLVNGPLHTPRFRMRRWVDQQFGQRKAAALGWFVSLLGATAAIILIVNWYVGLGRPIGF